MCIFDKQNSLFSKLFDCGNDVSFLQRAFPPEIRPLPRVLLPDLVSFKAIFFACFGNETDQDGFRDK
jgi:hypothetical protein